MNPLPVVALAVVADDVRLAHDYFVLQDPERGEGFVRLYFQTADRIALNPELFPIKFDDYRRALMPRFNYAIYFFLWDDRAVIAAVVDARRDPRLTRDLIRSRRDD